MIFKKLTFLGIVNGFQSRRVGIVVVRFYRIYSTVRCVGFDNSKYAVDPATDTF